MTLDIKNMTQTEFDNFMADLKVNNPNLFQFIVDFINNKLQYIPPIEDTRKAYYKISEVLKFLGVEECE